jgi:short-subunit dehydrogenase
MNIQLKPLEEQTIVITGASSGIGLVTAKMAARRGARVVLASRSKSDLRRATKEIVKSGGAAIYVVADVAEPDEVEAIADAAIREFDGFDTWVNNAGVSIYGRLQEVPLEDAWRLFETNYWGVVNGCTVAVPHLRSRGGALINIGSVLSDRAIPLQGHYAASKHAVKGYTDALRMELEEEGAPISVTLVKPSAIDTPYPKHARDLMDVEPKHPAPVYAPKTVARTILRCAERPTRDITVGGGGRMLATLGGLAPRLMDRYMEATMFGNQRSDEPTSRKRRDTLHKPQKNDAAERGDYPGYVMRTSAYTQAKLHPLRTVLAVAALGAGVAIALKGDALDDGGTRDPESR